MAKSKVSRKEQRRLEMERQRRRRLLTYGGGLAALVIAVVALVVLRSGGTDVEGATDFGAQSRGHDAGVIIETGELPPVGGTHHPQWQNCGIYDRPVDPKHAVHSMEHGAVWLAYRSTLPEEDVAVLREAVGGQTYVLMSPYPNLRSPVVMSAWGVQLEVPSVDDERIESFIGTYRLGPQTPEFGAPCDGGIGVATG